MSTAGKQRRDAMRKRAEISKDRQRSAAEKSHEEEAYGVPAEAGDVEHPVTVHQVRTLRNPNLREANTPNHASVVVSLSSV